jgi:hypothetical protein
MVIRENANVAALRRIADPVARAAACQVFIANGRETIRAAEQLRNDAIRDARQHGASTVDSLAAAIKVRRNVVVDALRSQPR